MSVIRIHAVLASQAIIMACNRKVVICIFIQPPVRMNHLVVGEILNNYEMQ